MGRDISEFRYGIGYDIHRLRKFKGGSFKLGGVDIGEGYRVIAHSDGDVILHSIIDAILGAIGYPGDIGTLFPMTEENKDADSSEFLDRVLDLALEIGFKVLQVDITVIAQRPRLSEYRLTIRQNLSKLLNLPQERIGLKFRTNERLGPIGAGRAIAAMSLVVLGKIGG